MDVQYTQGSHQQYFALKTGSDLDDFSASGIFYGQLSEDEPISFWFYVDDVEIGSRKGLGQIVTKWGINQELLIKISTLKKFYDRTIRFSVHIKLLNSARINMPKELIRKMQMDKKASKSVRTVSGGGVGTASRKS